MDDAYAKRLATRAVIDPVSRAEVEAGLGSIQDHIVMRDDGATSTKPVNFVINWKEILGPTGAALGIPGVAEWQFALALLIFVVQAARMGRIEFDGREAVLLAVLWRHKSRASGIPIDDLLPEVNGSLVEAGYSEIRAGELTRILRRLEQVKSVQVNSGRVALVEEVRTSMFTSETEET